MSGPTPRRLWNFVMRRLRLRDYFEDSGDGRRQPQIPLTSERLYRLRYLHRGKHRVQSSAQLLLHLWLSLSRPYAADSS